MAGKGRPHSQVVDEWLEKASREDLLNLVNRIKNQDLVVMVVIYKYILERNAE